MRAKDDGWRVDCGLDPELADYVAACRAGRAGSAETPEPVNPRPGYLPTVAKDGRTHWVRDLTGTRFGLLTVTALGARDGGNGRQWECRCDCGRTVTVAGKNLKSGVTRSCGASIHHRKRKETR